MPTTQPSPSVNRIELAVDTTPASLRAAQYVRTLLRPGMQLRVASVVENPRVLLPDLPKVDSLLAAARDELAREAQAALDRVTPSFADSGAQLETAIVDTSVTGGTTADALIADATAWQADLLAIGARQHHGLLRLIEGTVSESVMKRTRSALLIVPAGYERPIESPPQRMMFAVDGSEPSLHAVRVGMQLASPSTLLYAAYVVDRAVRLTDLVPVRSLEDAYRAEGQAALAEVGSLFAGRDNPTKRSLLETHPTSDDVAHAVMREAVHWHADLLVVGTHGRRGLAGWLLGSVARRVAQLAQVPVLLVRGQD
ncbi:UspA domain-containing protein [Burkholderia multivorans]